MIDEAKAIPLSSLNKFALSQQNKYYFLDMIAVVAVAAVEWNYSFQFELRSFHLLKLMCLFSHI